ncbi:MAG: Fur family transcriptional regulator [Bernardetiaceae bacterium]
MDKNALVSLLQDHGLRITHARKRVLSFFNQYHNALSHSEIERALGEELDRVTIYRTLKSFEEVGLIHKVPDDGAVVKYAACQSACDQHAHHDRHVHFKCTSCEQTACLNEAYITLPDLPKGYAAADFQVLVTGTCPKCQADV